MWSSAAVDHLHLSVGDIFDRGPTADRIILEADGSLMTSTASSLDISRWGDDINFGWGGGRLRERRTGVGGAQGATSRATPRS